MHFTSAHKAAVVVVSIALIQGAAAAPRRAAPQPALQGVVTQVIDGSTLAFTPTGQAAITVRLRDIEAPELCQPWGTEARDALAELALKKPAVLRAAGPDAQGRTLGLVLVEEVNLSQRLVEEGHAWSARGRNGHGPLLKQERMARALNRGLHAGGSAMLPSDFRRQNGACK